MNGWMINKHVKGLDTWVVPWMNMKKWINGWINELMSERMNIEEVEGWINVWILNFERCTIVQQWVLAWMNN